MAVFKPVSMGQDRFPGVVGQVMPKPDDLNDPKYGPIDLGGIPSWIGRRRDEFLYGSGIKERTRKNGKGGVPEITKPGPRYHNSLEEVDSGIVTAYALALRDAEKNGISVSYIPLPELQRMARSHNYPIKDSDGNDLTGFENGKGRVYLRDDLLSDLYEGLRTLGHELHGHQRGEDAAQAYEPEFVREYLSLANSLSPEAQQNLIREYYERLLDISRN